MSDQDRGVMPPLDEYGRAVLPVLEEMVRMLAAGDTPEYVAFIGAAALQRRIREADEARLRQHRVTLN